MQVQNPRTGRLIALNSPTYASLLQECIIPELYGIKLWFSILPVELLNLLGDFMPNPMKGWLPYYDIRWIGRFVPARLSEMASVGTIYGYPLVLEWCLQRNVQLRKYHLTSLIKSDKEYCLDWILSREEMMRKLLEWQLFTLYGSTASRYVEYLLSIPNTPWKLSEDFTVEAIQSDNLENLRGRWDRNVENIIKYALTQGATRILAHGFEIYPDRVPELLSKKLISSYIEKARHAYVELYMRNLNSFICCGFSGEVILFEVVASQQWEVFSELLLLGISVNHECLHMLLRSRYSLKLILKQLSPTPKWETCCTQVYLVNNKHTISTLEELEEAKLPINEECVDMILPLLALPNSSDPAIKYLERLLLLCKPSQEGIELILAHFSEEVKIQMKQLCPASRWTQLNEKYAIVLHRLQHYMLST